MKTIATERHKRLIELLIAKPESFDLARLVKAWEGWRGTSAAAS